MRGCSKDMEIATNDCTELAQVYTRFVRILRIMQGVATFSVGKAAVGLADAATSAAKKGVCASYAVLMSAQVLMHAILASKKDRAKKFQRALAFQRLVYAGIAVLNCLGVTQKREPEGLKA